MSIGVHITNHARLRYLERIRKFPQEKIKACQGNNEYEKIRTLQQFGVIDLKKLDREMLGDRPQRTLNQINVLKTCIYPVRTYFLKVVNKTVVTVFGGKQVGDKKKVGKIYASTAKQNFGDSQGKVYS